MALHTASDRPVRPPDEPPRFTHSDVVGGELLVPVIGGAARRYVNLDNAASTPALRSVADTVAEFLPYYSGVHRGTGYKSRVSTAAFEQARQIVGGFVGADPDRDVVVFTKNTTEAINKFAGTLQAAPGSVVLTTVLEHHSDDLPWRSTFRTVHVGLTADGMLDVDHLDQLLARLAGDVALLAVSGASNVTGIVQPVHELAAMVHAVGGRILVDAAQLAPHRRIDMGPHDDPGHLDAVVLSAHKLYAPFGTGVLVGPRTAFAAVPREAGGGTVRAVTTDTVAWAELPDREEAGSPNVVGAIALAAAIRVLDEVGLDRVAAQERALTGRHAEPARERGRLATARPADRRRRSGSGRRRPVHDRRDRPRSGGRRARLRARRRRAQRVLLRPSVPRPPARPRSRRGRHMGQQRIQGRQARRTGSRACRASAATTTRATSTGSSTAWSNSSGTAQPPSTASSATVRSTRSAIASRPASCCAERRVRRRA